MRRFDTGSNGEMDCGDLSMKSKIIAAAVAAVGAALLAQPAFANVITVAGRPATITCTPSCEAFTGGSPDAEGDPTTAGVLSGTGADLYDGQPSNEGDEAEKLSILIGSPGLFTSADGDKTEPPVNPFTTLAEFIILKLGDERVYIKNTSGGELLIAYAQNGASGLGLSHTTEFGQIPLPGAMWLMGAGLAGLGFAGRRKKKA